MPQLGTPLKATSPAHMDLRVEQCDGTNLPHDCYVGVRVGDILKQGRYEPERCYSFPRADGRRSVKVDVYQHVGSAVLTVDPDTQWAEEVGVTSSHPAFQGIRLKVMVQTRAGSEKKQQQQQREDRMKALKGQATDYLSTNRIEERLSAAVKALLKVLPEDPMEFICQQIRGSVVQSRPATPPVAPAGVPLSNGRQEPVVAVQPLGTPQDEGTAVLPLSVLGSVLHTKVPEQKTPASKAPPKLSPQTPGKEMASVRLQAFELLRNASLDGTLQMALEANEPPKVPPPRSDLASIHVQAHEPVKSTDPAGKSQAAVEAEPGAAARRAEEDEAQLASARSELAQRSERGLLFQRSFELPRAHASGLQGAALARAMQPAMLMPMSCLVGSAFPAVGLQSGLLFV